MLARKLERYPTTSEETEDKHSKLLQEQLASILL